MTEEHDNNNKRDVFDAEIRMSPEGGLIINGVSFKELEDYITAWAIQNKDAGCNWWTLAVGLSQIAVQQIAGVDHKMGGVAALVNYSELIAHIYRNTRKAMEDNAMLVVDPSSLN